MKGLLQRLGGRPKSPSKSIAIGTDVATLVIFHPDDLAHRDDHPLDWYAAPFAYHREASAGRLIGFSVGADGGYKVRFVLPAGEVELTPDEAQRYLLRFDFRLKVAHGRILLDNTDFLPSEERRRGEPDEAAWFELPNGLYRASVHVLQMTQASADRNDPTHVVALHGVDEAQWRAIPVTAGLPDLEPFARDRRRLRLLSGEALEDALAAHEAAYARRLVHRIDAGVVSALVLPANVSVLPGETATIAVPSEWLKAFEEGGSRRGLFDVSLVAGTSLTRGAIVTELACHGSFIGLDRAGIEVRGVGVRRVEADCRADFGAAATFCELSVPVEAIAAAELAIAQDPPPAPAEVARLKGAVLALIAEAEGDPSRLGKALKSPSFERERVEAMRSPESLTGWLLEHLHLTGETRLELYLASDAERLVRLTQHLLAGRT